MVASLLLLGILASSYAGLIQNLPGAPKVSFREYAGYFDVSGGHHLHYWFSESQNNPTIDPVLIWLTGGPGCSGLAALLTEQGPYTVQPDGKTLKINPYSWNRIANVLTIESPAGVGYSYADDGDVSTDDDKVALDTWSALKAFYTEFPQYRKNAFYITGESYGGIYIPTLADTILKKQNEFHINIKGVAIGNGCVSEKLGVDTIIQYVYNHGMVDEATWQRVNTECCGGEVDGCAFSQFTGSDFCGNFTETYSQGIWFSGLDPYDMYSDCPTNSKATKRRPSRAMLDFFQKIKNRVPDSNTASTCRDDAWETQYLNQPEVRKALFVPDNLPAWEQCSNEVYFMYEQLHNEMASYVKNMIEKGLRVLVYNGDTDLVCNFLMGQKFVAQLGYPVTSPCQTYQVEGQVGGFHTEYGKAEFVTVRGAGHMVPTDRPATAFHMIQAFLSGQRP